MHFDQFKRHEFFALLGGAAAWSLTARAQQIGRTCRLGFLNPVGRQAPAVLAFFDELRINGFVEGENLGVIEDGFDVTKDHISELAASLVKAAPDAIVAGPERSCGRFGK
jgi:hypothetical protein